MELQKNSRIWWQRHLCVSFFFTKKKTYKAQRFVGLKELIYHFVFLHLFQHKIGSFQTKSSQAKPSPATTVGSSCHFWTLTVLNNSCKHCRLFMSVCLSGDLARIGNEWKKMFKYLYGYISNERTDRRNDWFHHIQSMTGMA